MDMATLQTIQSVYWPVYVCACALAVIVGLGGNRPGLLKCTTLLIAGSVAMSLYELWHPFTPWWGMLAIDIPIFGLVTAPPRYRVQAYLAGIIFTQILMHVLWGFTADIAGAGPLHWFGNTMAGFGKCAVLLLWSGGERVEMAFSAFGRAVADLVQRSPKTVLR
jgi:hypothetical protein